LNIALPLAIPWFAAVALALLDGRRRWVGLVAVAALAGNAAALLALTLDTFDAPRELVAGGWPTGIGIVLRADALGALFALLTSSVVLAALVYEVLRGVRTRAFPAVVLFMSTGLTGLFLTGDVFNFYVFFELSMISAYVLTGYGGSSRQVGGAFIFAVVNLLGSFIFLIAIGALYHVTGTLEMSAVAERMTEVEPTSGILIGVTFFVAFGVKLGLFPFHFWLPIVYTGTPPAVAAMLSGGLANIGTYGILRFGAGILPAQLELGTEVLLVLGALSIVYGALQAISRTSASEVLAYSAIGQVGYVLIALALGGPVGYAAAVLAAAVNSLNKTLLFLATGLRGWLVGAAFAVGALSVAGVPPSAGFFAKLAVFQAGIEERSWVLVGLVFLGGALSFVYMFQIYQREHWSDRALEEADAGPASAQVLRAIALGLAAAVLALGVWPEPLLAISREAGDLLAGGPG